MWEECSLSGVSTHREREGVIEAVGGVVGGAVIQLSIASILIALLGGITKRFLQK